LGDYINGVHVFVAIGSKQSGHSFMQQFCCRYIAWEIFWFKGEVVDAHASTYAWKLLTDVLFLQKHMHGFAVVSTRFSVNSHISLQFYHLRVLVF
jgi:hypothetical protein